jgi:hypothetical protein
VIDTAESLNEVSQRLSRDHLVLELDVDFAARLGAIGPGWGRTTADIGI